MWLATFMKTTAAVSGLFVAAGIAWGVQGVEAGNGVGAAGDAAKPTVASGKEGQESTITLNGDAARKSEGQAVRTSAGGSDNQPTFQGRAMVPPESNEAIKAELAEQQKALSSKVQELAAATAELEMAQLEKSMAQRELEKAHEAAITLELARNDRSSDESVRQLALLKKRIEESKDRLNALAQDTAKLSAQHESLQLEVNRAKNNVSEMEAAERGWFLSHDVRVRQPAPVTTTRERVIKPAAAATFEAVPTIEAQVPQWELERQAWKLKAQAFRLKADAYKNSADAARANGTATPTSTAEAESLLMQADANHAEAMALELTKQIEGLRGEHEKEAQSYGAISVQAPASANQNANNQPHGQVRVVEGTAGVYPDSFQKAVLQQMETMRQSILILRNENAELKKQIIAAKPDETPLKYEPAEKLTSDNEATVR